MIFNRVVIILLIAMISLQAMPEDEKTILRLNNVSQIQEMIFLDKGMLLVLLCNKYPIEQSSDSNIIEMKVLRWVAVENGYEYWDQENRKHLMKKISTRDDGAHRYIIGEARYLKVAKSIILQKVQSLASGRYPNSDTKLNGDWPFFDPRLFNDFEQKGEDKLIEPRGK